jgi:hypothetical protein
MKYKPGDEVFVKAEITDISDCEERPYFVAPDCHSIYWVSEDKIIPMDKTYADGLTDAWGLAKKLANLSSNEFAEIFGAKGLYSIVCCFSYEEVLAKIEAYKNGIKVGDVVVDEEGTKALVIDEATENTCFVFTENGCVEDWYKMDLKKTGNKISIESLLRQIGE